jgi:hypothetical protein
MIFMQYEDRLHRLLKKSRKKLGAPGIALGLSVNGDHYFASSGLANLANEEKYSMNTRFKTGRLVEIFLSILFFQMVEKGIVNTTDSLTKYHPDLNFHEARWNMRYLSFDALLTHTSGLGDLRNDGDIFLHNKGLYPDRDLRSMKLVDYYKVPLKQFFASQTQFYHSHHNYALLAMSLQEMSDTPLDLLLAKNIIQPLELTGSSLYESNSQIVQGYTSLSKKKVIYASDTYPALFTSANAVTSIQDLLLIFDELSHSYVGDSSKLLDFRSANNLFRSRYNPHTSLDAVSAPFFIRSKSPLILEYSSSICGTMTSLYLLPEYRTSFIVTMNIERSERFGIAVRKMFEIICKDLQILVPELSPTPDPIPSTLSSEDLKSIEGVYRPDKPSLLNLTYLKHFGNDVFIKTDKSGKIITKNILAITRRKSEYRGGKELQFLRDNQGALVYTFQANGHLNRIVFPKRHNPGFIYLQEDGPITLYRSKFNYSISRYFGMAFFFFFSTLRHQVFIPVLRRVGQLLLLLPGYAWLTIIWGSTLVSHFMRIHVPRFLRFLGVKTRVFSSVALRYIQSAFLYSKNQVGSTRINEKAKSLWASAKDKTQPAIDKIFSRVINATKAIWQFTIRGSSAIWTKLSGFRKRIFHWFSPKLQISKIFFATGFTSAKIIGRSHLRRLSNAVFRRMPDNLLWFEDLVKEVISDLTVRQEEIQTYKELYPSRFSFNKKGLMYIKYLMGRKLERFESTTLYQNIVKTSALIKTRVRQ